MAVLTQRERKMVNKAFDISLEVEGIANITRGLELASRASGQGEHLTESALEAATYAVCTYLERIALDLSDIAGEASINT